jgi:hypothetical protein
MYSAAVNSLEQTPPLPALQSGPYPLHTLLGFDFCKHIVCMSPRDPKDVDEMPPNGKDSISVKCMRGVRKVCALRSSLMCSLNV